MPIFLEEKKIMKQKDQGWSSRAHRERLLRYEHFTASDQWARPGRNRSNNSAQNSAIANFSSGPRRQWERHGQAIKWDLNASSFADSRLGIMDVQLPNARGNIGFARVKGEQLRLTLSPSTREGKRQWAWRPSTACGSDGVSRHALPREARKHN